MKWQKGMFVFGMVFMVFMLTYVFVTNLAFARANEPEAVTAVFPVIADFEGGAPPDWFQYNGGGSSVSPGFVTVGDADPWAQPGQVGDTGILSGTFNVTDFGGFGALLPRQNWSDYDAISFWFYGQNSGFDFTVEVQDGSDAVVERFHATFTDDFTGWQQIVLPFSTFFRGGFQDGGAPDNGFQLTQVAAWVFPLPAGSGSYVLDEIALVNLVPFADFEGGVPAGWFVYGDWGNITIDTSVPTISDTDSLAVPGQVGFNDVLSMTVNVPTWAGFGAGFTPVQNWSDMQGVSFWFYGENSGTTHEFEIQTAPGDDRRATFVDDFVGWQLIVLPFSSFGATPYDVSQVDNWVFVLDGTIGSFKLDHMSVYGDAGNITLRTQFESGAYSVAEGETAVLTVTLNTTSTEDVTVDYATADGTAGSSDYTPVSGTLTFLSGETQQTISVNTTDNTVYAGNKTFTVQLSDPISVTLGNPSQATVTIVDDEEPDPSTAKLEIIDDFESGIPSGVDGDGLDIGYVTWGDTWNGTTAAVTTTLVPDTDPLALPNQSGDNNLYKIDLNVVGWGGTTHAFANDTVDTWTPQDWSSYEGIAFWLYGNNTGNTLLFEINENRNPGSTTNDVEIWNYTFTDNFSGWKYFELGFNEFTRKEIGNGAPNDGLTLEEVHGWAFGSLATGGAGVTYYMDNVAVVVRTLVIDDFESGSIPSGSDGNGLDIGYVTWGDFWNGTTSVVTVTTVADSDPLALPGQSGDNIVYQLDVNVAGWGGTTHAFENGTLDTWVSQDWSSYEGICFWVYGQNTGNDLLFEINENRNPGSTTADTEIWSHPFTDDFSGWKFFALDFSTDFTRKEIGNGAPNDGFTRDEVHGWAFGSLATGGADVTYYIDNVIVFGNTGSDQPLKAEFEQGKYSVEEGETAVLVVSLNKPEAASVTVDYASAEANAREDRQYTPVSGTLTFPPGVVTQTIEVPTFADGKHTGDKRVAINLYENSVPLGFQRRTILTIVDTDPADPRLVDDFEGFHPFVNVTGDVDLSITTIMDSETTAVPGQPAYEDVLTVDFDTTSTPASFDRIFSQGQDWSSYDGLSLWYYGSNSGEEITLQLKDNMITTTGYVDPSEWELVWSDEFNDPAGTPPNPNVWQHELGDGALNEIVGWGNSESQYYTNDPANASTDGSGNLVIRLQEVDTATTDLVCWYGPCEYTSARLITQDRLDFEYGRIEARVQVPGGPGGLWPAFWMLGDNIGEVGWPQSGEIDIMEYVSRLPNEVFGTIHGPGYAGGQSFGNTLTFTDTVPNQGFMTYGVEWTPNLIIWYVDDVQYHQAVPANVAPNAWVFNHPFFIILNAAIGGNFGGQISDDMTMPQDTLVDYVRVYQAADTAERFEASFVDDFTGWQKISLPFSDFMRSADQPVGAPDDGLTLTDVWGYGFIMPDGVEGSFHMDRVYLEMEYIYYFPVMFKN
jgi:beta-glucanase (GH16 family)